MRQRGRRDKVVVITGAGSGIGRATASAFARNGAIVVAAGRQGKIVEEVAEDCRKRTGRALGIATDVTHEDEVQHLARTTLDTFGRIDVWVNNAAVTAFGRFEDIPSDVFRRVIDTNFLGYVHGARAVLPIFRQQGNGVLINVASVVAYVPQPWTSAYVCSKFAVRALSECLRMELLLDGARDIHVCTVLPPSIDTPLFQRGANYTGRAVRPIPPVHKPDDVANVIVALAERPLREVFVGSVGPLAALFHNGVPRLSESMFAHYADRGQFQHRPAPPGPGNVFAPASSAPRVLQRMAPVEPPLESGRARSAKVRRGRASARRRAP
jgi:NAD(P)-dependent dehydrogenase (short-subunit alcohol dehydrogenase family)